MKNSCISRFSLAIILLFISILSFTTPSIAAPTQLDSIVAMVGNEAITFNQLQEFAKAVLQQQPHIKPTKEFYMAVLNNMINTKLQLQIAKRSNIWLNDDKLNATIKSMAENKKQTVAEFKSEVEKNGLNFNAFREHVRNEVISNKFKQAYVSNKIFIAPKEVNNFINSYAGATSIGIRYSAQQISITGTDAKTEAEITSVVEKLKNGTSLDITPSTEGTTSNTGLKEKLLEHKAITEFPNIIAEAILKLAPNEVSPPIKTGNGWSTVKLLSKSLDVQPQAITKLHIRHILLKPSDNLSITKATEKLNDLQLQIEQGADFGELAKANSEDFGSAQHGGDIGWVTQDVLDPEFYKNISTLKPNQISKPFSSSFGIHIAQVLEVKEETNNSDQIYQKAYQIIYMRKVEEISENIILQLRDESFIEIKITPEELNLLMKNP